MSDWDKPSLPIWGKSGPPESDPDSFNKLTVNYYSVNRMRYGPGRGNTGAISAGDRLRWPG